MSLAKCLQILIKYWPSFFLGIRTTLFVSLTGTIIGLVIGLLVGGVKAIVPDKKSIAKKIYDVIATIYIEVFRGTPMMVQAMIFKYSCQAMGVNWNLILHDLDVFNGWFVAGLIVITFNTAAYMGEIVKSGINGVDAGQYEGAISLGMTHFQAYRYVIFPQAIKNALPTILNEYIVNVKDSSVLNVIGLTELYATVTIATSKNYFVVEGYILIAVIYLVLTLAATFIVRIINAKLEGKKINWNPFHKEKPLAIVE